MKTKESWKTRLRAFRRWQRMPHQVKPLSDEEHECGTCHTRYKGNYCPRCGQSARIGRYSFRSALLLFLDVWGLGNRGMFRTIRDLILRPGYMILDYLKGMQMAYFPPFKMLFLLTALSILVAHGFNIRGKNNAAALGRTPIVEVKPSHAPHTDSIKAATGKEMAEVLSEETGDTTGLKAARKDAKAAADLTPAQKERVKSEFEKVGKRLDVNSLTDLQERYPNIFTLLVLVVMTFFLYPFFAKTKNIEHLRFSEFFIANVYISNMMTIYETVLSFFCISSGYAFFFYLLELMAFRQFSGFSRRRTFFSCLAGFLLTMVAVVAVVMLVIILMVLFFDD